MEEEKINRGYLETLSFSDLVKLADEYGVDVPEDLDRRFLISELLELAEESQRDEDFNVVSSADDNLCMNTHLPKGYNETQISCILRNPVWAFVFWDISENDLHMLKAFADYSLALRVCILSSEKDLTPVEVFEIEIPKNVNEQYVLIPSGKQFIRIELVYSSGAGREVLAFSSVITIPKGSDFVENMHPGLEKNISDIVKLSGIEKILTEHYKNYCHSFS
ncbi:MAG: DUF4912 domain-containing protein [Treponema sp.]|jgi:hypothetical protein|nr:DUF4912 domain-containing protein [Treponema sp.]